MPRPAENGTRATAGRTMINLARALHVLGVVWWIGGVVMVTATILPALARSGLTDADRLGTLRHIRRLFARQARGALLVVGASGAYMLYYLGGIARLRPALGWWIDLMVVTWGAFALILFVLEPLGLMQKAGLMRRPRAFLLVHVVLAGLALATVTGAVVGAHGGLF